MKLKQSGTRPATIQGVCPEIVFAIMVAQIEYWGVKPGGRMVVTGGTDGKEWRKPWSLHPSGKAFDIRDRNLPESLKKEFAVSLREALGDEFDVVQESDHIHVEFDPKD